MEKVLPPDLDAIFTTYWEGPLDGKQITRESLGGFGLFPWQIVSKNWWWSRPLKKGEVGFSIHHWRCWKDALEQNIDKAVFFEDDVVLVESFREKLSHAIRILETRHKGWDLLYLGRQTLHENHTLPTILTRDTPVDDSLVRPGYSLCSHAYMLSRTGIQKALSVGFENAIIPIDEFLPALYIIHPRADVARRYRPSLNAFAMEPSVAYQLPKDYAGSDTEASDFIDWDLP